MEEGKESNGVPALPPEMLIHLMSFLQYSDRKAAGEVSTLWHSASVSSVFCDEEKITLKRLTEQEGLQLVEDFANTRREFFNIFLVENKITPNWYSVWEFFGPKTRCLSFTSCSISDTVFIDLLKNFSALQSLEIIDCSDLFLHESLFSDREDVIVLRETLTNVQKLRLSFNHTLSDEMLERMFFIMPKLKSLGLDFSPMQCHSGLIKRFYPQGWVTEPYSLSVLTVSYLIKYLEGNGNDLQSLDLSSTVIDSQSISKLLRIQGLSLKALCLTVCRELKDDGLKAIISYQPNLELLHLSHCNHITDDSIHELSKITTLKDFTLSNCAKITDCGMSGMNLLNLTKLHLDVCDKVTAEGLRAGIFSRINQILTYLSISAPMSIRSRELFKRIPACFPKLRHLLFCGCNGLLDDIILQSILPGISKLYTLEIRNNLNITDAGLTGIGRPKCCIAKSDPEVPTLDDFYKNIDFGGQDFFQQTTIRNIKSLRKLTITGNKLLTDMTLAEGIIFQELQILDLSGCLKISTVGTGKVSEGNPNLRMVKMIGCLSITDESVEYLVKNLKRLAHLDLQGCHLLTRKALDMVLKYGEKLSFIDVRSCPLMENTAEFVHLPFGTRRADINNRKPLFYAM